ncbi:hypothetical protein RI820_001011 [Pluralibacter gergoviae]|nr:hypothetical protein [Pluralibacter gergoviae]ELC3016150.1 hypothetical protein [Pluralibacter gergoviae]ELC3021130.1 hypothetical protein [Pluralibacter gergoviae]
MITSEKAIQIAEEYAEEYQRGWDHDHHEATKVNLQGEPVWMISTSDIKYNEDLPWLMEHFPNPVYYYISMVSGLCIAVGNRRNEIFPVKRKGS